VLIVETLVFTVETYILTVETIILIVILARIVSDFGANVNAP